MYFTNHAPVSITLYWFSQPPTLQKGKNTGAECDKALPIRLEDSGFMSHKNMARYDPKMLVENSMKKYKKLFKKVLTLAFLGAIIEVAFE